MNSHEVIRQAIKKSSAKQIAAALGVSQSLVYKWTESNPAGDGAVANPLERVAQLFDLSGEDDLIQWLCQRAGGYFVRNPPSARKSGIEVVPATQKIVQQFADLLGTIGASAADSAITENEATLIRDVWDELKSHTEAFVKCCEQGDFAHLREWIKNPA
ncbi:MAG: helix-turn-helix domain containing protein [Verrucomicrobiaceae bacterium]|nr:helix-turn-helix domain containing protein [Verrucomicrobiaceae bacterium]